MKRFCRLFLVRRSIEGVTQKHLAQKPFVVLKRNQQGTNYDCGEETNYIYVIIICAVHI